MFLTQCKLSVKEGKCGTIRDAHSGAKFFTFIPHYCVALPMFQQKDLVSHTSLVMGYAYSPNACPYLHLRVLVIQTCYLQLLSQPLEFTYCVIVSLNQFVHSQYTIRILIYVERGGESLSIENYTIFPLNKLYFNSKEHQCANNIKNKFIYLHTYIHEINFDYIDRRNQSPNGSTNSL